MRRGALIPRRVGDLRESRRPLEGRGLEAELAVGRLAAALAALFDRLLLLQLQHGDDLALVDVAAGDAGSEVAVVVRLSQHRSGTSRTLHSCLNRHWLDAFRAAATCEFLHILTMLDPPCQPDLGLVDRFRAVTLRNLRLFYSFGAIVRT